MKSHRGLRSDHFQNSVLLESHGGLTRGCAQIIELMDGRREQSPSHLDQDWKALTTEIVKVWEVTLVSGMSCGSKGLEDVLRI
jgi:hypothetical protein